MDKQRFDPPAPSELAPDVPEDLNALCIDLFRRRPEDRPLRTRSAAPAGEPGGHSDQAFEETGAHPSASRRRVTVRVPLVGRQRHRQALDEALTAMGLGRTVALYLHGPSGAGKTALLKTSWTSGSSGATPSSWPAAATSESRSLTRPSIA